MKARIKKVTIETYDLDGKVIDVEVEYYPQVKYFFFWCNVCIVALHSLEMAKTELFQHLGNKRTKVEYINFE